MKCDWILVEKFWKVENIKIKCYMFISHYVEIKSNWTFVQQQLVSVRNQLSSSGGSCSQVWI